MMGSPSSPCSRLFLLDKMECTYTHKGFSMTIEEISLSNSLDMAAATFILATDDSVARQICLLVELPWFPQFEKKIEDLISNRLSPGLSWIANLPKYPGWLAKFPLDVFRNSILWLRLSPHFYHVSVAMLSICRYIALCNIANFAVIILVPWYDLSVPEITKFPLLRFSGSWPQPVLTRVWIINFSSGLPLLDCRWKYQDDGVYFLTWKYNFLPLLQGIEIETHFPLMSPSLNLFKWS